MGLALGMVLLLVTSARAQGARPDEPRVAQAGRESTESSELPDANALSEPAPAPDLTAFLGKPLLQVVLVERYSGVERVVDLRLVRAGEGFSAAVTRRAMAELLEHGDYAEIEAQVEAHGHGVRLRLVALERRVVTGIEVSGGSLGSEQVLSAARIAAGDEVTRPELDRVAQRVAALYRRRGFPDVVASAEMVPSHEPRRVGVRVEVQPGRPLTVERRRFEVTGPLHPELSRQLETYAVGALERADEERLNEADEALTQQLQRSGWYHARVSHRLDGAQLVVEIDAGYLYRVRFEGNRSFDASALLAVLELDAVDRSSEGAMLERVRDYYVARGFLDVEVRVEDRPAPGSVDRVFVIRERGQVKVQGRTFPCLRGQRSSAQVNDEIDGVLSEALPGADDWLGPPSSQLVDESMGSRGGRRVEPLVLDPWRSYAPEAYDRALTHLRDLYRSEGYLSAVVGPVSVLRRACAPNSKPGRCEPLGVRVAPESICPEVDNPVPVEDPAPDPGLTCVPDPMRGISCEPNVVLSIPVKLGPRTVLWNVEFAGNTRVLEQRLAEVAALELGRPVSQVELQKARRRLLDLYADEGYAFASVDVDLELSQDHTRGSARFVISERERVEISAIVVRGAQRTSESLILGRLELKAGDVYRRQAVRQSEEQLATLGVFASVAISLEDPDVPAKRKVMLVEVVERFPQYVDIKPGLSTGEGARIALEYGHRNLDGKAMQLRFRVQLGYLPGFLIFEDDVREDFEQLSLANRIERRNTVTLELPVGKRYRFAIDGIDVRDNSRDFGITKRALILTLTHRPSRVLSLVTGPSFELNDARVFGDTQNLQQYLEANPEQVRLLNVPEGRSFAVAWRVGSTWDRTDNPLGPTRGTLVSAEIEPVVAYLTEDSAAVQLEACQGAGNDPATCEFTSRFLKFTNRLAGYIPFTDTGLSLALSVRWGANFQLVDNSSTYPDRLFFLGGADSLRGYLQASLIPQDIAEQLQEEDPDAPNQESRLTARKVVIRGGDFILNPRVELRIPLTKLLHTAVFLDTGNVWRDIDNVDPTVLRYTAGSGLRVITPVGPLAFDYGFKLDRRFYETDVGAFHFSVGLF